MKGAMLLYVLCEDKREAEDISRLLLQKHLVACTNIVHPVSSEYFWPPGSRAMVKSNETLLLAKTLESKWDKIEKEILKIHSYDNPAILALPLLHVTKKYYDWIVSELAK
jgi:periplasmic divalent cation tolerance protein